MKSTKFYRVYDKTLNTYISTSKSSLWDSTAWAMHAATGYLRHHSNSCLEIHTFDRETAQIQQFIDFKKTFDEARDERVAAEAAKRERAERAHLEHTASMLKQKAAEIAQRLTELDQK
jgi:hypothetical protein